jgi:hypothetical protein
MAFIPVPETAEVRMQFTQANQKVENVYHVRRQGAWTQEDLTSLANIFGQWWLSAASPPVTHELVLTQVVATDISQAGGMSVLGTTGLPAPGDQGAGGYPNNVTLAIKWGTGLAGRSFRGRTYHLGLPLGQVLPDGTVSPAHLELIRAGYDALRTALDNATIGVEFVVVSRYSGVDVNHKPIPRAEGITTPISGVSVENVTDSQRRRLPGRGQ